MACIPRTKGGIALAVFGDCAPVEVPGLTNAVIESVQNQTSLAKAKADPKALATPKGPETRKRPSGAPETQVAKKQCKEKETMKVANGTGPDSMAGLRQRTTNS